MQNSRCADCFVVKKKVSVSLCLIFALTKLAREATNATIQYNRMDSGNRERRFETKQLWRLCLIVALI